MGNEMNKYYAMIVKLQDDLEGSTKKLKVIKKITILNAVSILFVILAIIAFMILYSIQKG
jgi:hypothetical protein